MERHAEEQTSTRMRSLASYFRCVRFLSAWIVLQSVVIGLIVGAVLDSVLWIWLLSAGLGLSGAISFMVRWKLQRATMEQHGFRW